MLHIIKCSILCNTLNLFQADLNCLSLTKQCLFILKIRSVQNQVPIEQQCLTTVLGICNISLFRNNTTGVYLSNFASAMTEISCMYTITYDGF